MPEEILEKSEKIKIEEEKARSVKEKIRLRQHDANVLHLRGLCNKEIAKVAGKFIQDFANTIEFWKLQITQLEHLKDRAKDLDTLMKIMREQSDRYEKILVLARQGELIEALRKLNHGDVRA